jgi:hypothetical protein
MSDPPLYSGLNRFNVTSRFVSTPPLGKYSLITRIVVEYEGKTYSDVLLVEGRLVDEVKNRIPKDVKEYQSQRLWIKRYRN